MRWRTERGLVDMPRMLLVEDDSALRILVEHVLFPADHEIDACDT